MSSVHSPQEKKKLSYERDHRAKGKHDKGFRKKWPLKKRKAVRSFRHAVDSLTKAALLDGEADSKISAVEPKRLQKWGAPSLREYVQHHQERRRRSVGAKKARRATRSPL